MGTLLGDFLGLRRDSENEALARTRAQSRGLEVVRNHRSFHVVFRIHLVSPGLLHPPQRGPRAQEVFKSDGHLRLCCVFFSANSVLASS